MGNEVAKGLKTAGDKIMDGGQYVAKNNPLRDNVGAEVIAGGVFAGGVFLKALGNILYKPEGKKILN